MPDARASFEVSALALLMPELDPVLAPLRRIYTADGAAGVGAHITVLFPFCSHEHWGAEIADQIATAVGDMEPFELVFRRLERFQSGSILYLAPEPAAQVLHVVRTLAGAFPEYPLYGGDIPLDAYVPHVTVAVASDQHRLDAIEAEVVASLVDLLPLQARVDTLWFMTRGGQGWQRHTGFPLGLASACLV
jgi:2'-5' RNA ligase